MNTFRHSRGASESEDVQIESAMVEYPSRACLESAVPDVESNFL